MSPASRTSPDTRVAVLEAEPQPHVAVPFGSAPQLSAVLGRLVALRNRRLPGQSEHAAGLAVGAWCVAGLDEKALTQSRGAAPLHDLGRVVVPVGVRNRAGGPTVAETEQFHMPMYWTHRISSECRRRPHSHRSCRLTTNAPTAAGATAVIRGANYRCRHAHRAYRVTCTPPGVPLADAARLLARDADEGVAGKWACALVLERRRVSKHRGSHRRTGPQAGEVQVFRDAYASIVRLPKFAAKHSFSAFVFYRIAVGLPFGRPDAGALRPSGERGPTAPS
ncbi:hypothetical protein ACWZEH_00800 [Streptomyces sp. QTS137]